MLYTKWYLLALVFYTALWFSFFLSQRRMIFHPSRLTGSTPSGIGLQYKIYTFLSDNSLSLSSWFLPAPDEIADPFTILYCHGNAANLSHLLAPAKALHNQGYSVLLFDYREYGESSHSSTGLSEESVVSDAHAAYRHLNNMGIPDHRILLWGQSLGSAIAARLAAETNPAGLILEGSFPSTFRLSRRLYPYLLMPSFCIWDKFETDKYVNRRRCPLLVIHASDDEIIPADLGWRVFEKAVEPKKWLCIPGAGHNNLPLDQPQLHEMLLWLASECRH